MRTALRRKAAKVELGTLRELEAHPSTDADEVWELRDAGRDPYTPASDALAQLLPADQRFTDVHAGMLGRDGSRLDLRSGPVQVPQRMRHALLRQRTVSVLRNGPADYPLLTLFDKYVPDPHWAVGAPAHQATMSNARSSVMGRRPALVRAAGHRGNTDQSLVQCVA
ncbi:hypothetical protein JKP75_09715 [Blastococcus sp. TML/M2B]|uniref:hypothetical protein n=1 Tax=unclassified Blastococcus TaxID=2619396 RepID=UPI00190D667A|nr:MULTISPECIES: hypothetical protein [unclassified Blastococcus]MBN1092809.1 hypothetical protein [Blastococcus sp. TML/M2B]MBN1097084.1 hypothetical protein [Blastococcus sp. TML/C7B]